MIFFLSNYHSYQAQQHKKRTPYHRSKAHIFTVFIGNIPKVIKEKRFLQLLDLFGNVKHHNWAVDGRQNFLGFCLVQFETIGQVHRTKRILKDLNILPPGSVGLEGHDNSNGLEVSIDTLAFKEKEIVDHENGVKSPPQDDDEYLDKLETFKKQLRNDVKNEFDM